MIWGPKARHVPAPIAARMKRRRPTVALHADADAETTTVSNRIDCHHSVIIELRLYFLVGCEVCLQTVA